VKSLKFVFLLLIAIFLASAPGAAEARNGVAAITSECQPHNGYTYCLSIQYDIDCDGWQVTWYGWYSPDGGPWSGGAPIEPIPAYSGSWDEPGVYESAVFEMTLRLYIAGEDYVDLPISRTFEEPEACDTAAVASSQCRSTNLYYMYTLRDASQPAGWQKYCYIISDNGYPSVEAQALLCSVPGFDHTYQATSAVFAGWVTKDCTGQIHYGWPAWDSSWYRPGFAN
jgi:hypothetical protein